MSIEHSITETLRGKLEKDELVLPTLPEVAFKVCEAVQDPNTSLKQVSDIVSTDAALSARLIRVANSALYTRGSVISTLPEAVSRIGLFPVRNVVTSAAMEQLYTVSNGVIGQQLTRCWRTSTTVAGSAFALHRIYTEEVGPSRLQDDVLTLMGIVHNIGWLPILIEFEKMPDMLDKPEAMQRVIDALSGDVGSAILKQWGFDERFQRVVGSLQDFDYQPSSPDHIDFIRMAAIHAGVFGSSDERKEELLGQYVEKGLLVDINVFSSRTFIDYYQEASLAFA